jgi:hypothetical protein
MDFQRELYFSQSEVCKLYKISAKKFKKIITDNNLPVIENEITLHTSPEGKPYQVKSIYVKKIDFIKSNI